MQPFEGEAPPTVPFQHFPDPTATDFDSDGEPIPQKLYAPHWGTVDPFGHTAVGSLPPLNRPLDPAPLGDAANIERYSTDFEQVLRIGTCLLACGVFEVTIHFFRGLLPCFELSGLEKG